MSLKKISILIGAAAALSACGDSFAPGSKLEGLRLLAVQAEPPELAPGQVTRLRALAIDTEGAPISCRWTACMVPESAACLAAEPQSHLIALGDGMELDATVPQISREDFGPADGTGGYYLPIRLDLSATSTLAAIYPLRIAGNEAPNRNPGLDSVLVVAGGGETRPLPETQPLEIEAGAKLTLRAGFAEGSREEGEILRVSWFASAGSLSQPVTGDDKPDTEWSAGEALPENTPIDLYAVVRDGRGGTAWIHRTLITR